MAPEDALRRLPDRAGALASWSAGHPLRAAGLALLVVLVAGAGLANLETSPDPADAVPRGTGAADASDAVTDDFKSTTLQKATVQFQVAPDRCRSDSLRNIPERHGPDGSQGPSVDCGNVTDEVYLRAMEEFYRFVTGHPATDAPGGVVTYMMGPSTFYKLGNWSLAGGQDDAPPDAFTLPPADDRTRWRAVEEVARGSLADAIGPTVNPNRTAASAILVVEPDDPRSVPTIGEDVLAARDAYVDWVRDEGNYTVFAEGNEPLVAADPPAEQARTSDVVAGGLAKAVPAAALAAGAVLLAGTRRPRGAAVGLAASAGALASSAGVAGWTGAGMSPYLLAVLPVPAGLALDAALRLQEPRVGDDPWTRAGAAATPSLAAGGAAVAAGGLAWALSPAPLVAAAGVALAAGGLLAPLVAFLLVPALAAAPPDPKEAAAGLPAPAALVPGAPGRRAAGIALLALLVAAAPGLAGLTAAPPQPAVRNLPEDDPFRQEHTRSQTLFFGPEAEEHRYRSHILVVRGDVLDPETHRYLDTLWGEVRDVGEREPAVDASTSRHLPFLVRKWQEVGNGTESVAESRLGEAAPGSDDGSDYPGSRQEVEATLDAIFDSPMATFGSLLVDHPRDSITVVPVLLRTGDVDDLRQARSGMREAVQAAEGDRPDDVRVDLAGPGSTMLLLHEEQTPWLAGLVAASLAAGAGLAGLLRGRRAAGRALLVPLAAGLAAFGLAGGLGWPVTPMAAAPLAVAAATAGWGLPRRRPQGSLLAGAGLAALAAPLALVPYAALSQAGLLAAAAALVGGLAGAVLAAGGGLGPGSQG